ncbi:tetratricopeptide repeat protein [Iningainema tapete]|nr:tetratricopeptide repeat protein [Iningainema tapete]
MKSAFIHLFSGMIVGILTVTGTSPVLAQFGDTEQPSQERTQLVQKANALYNEGNFPEAEKSIRSLLKKYPKDAFGHYQLGNILFRQGKPEEAITSYQKAISLNSSYALAHNALGVVLAEKGQREEAISEYQKALKINPDYGDALTNLAQTLWQQGKKTEAIASMEKALNVFKQQQRRDKAYRVEQFLRQMKTQDDPSVS